MSKTRSGISATPKASPYQIRPRTTPMPLSLRRPLQSASTVPAKFTTRPTSPRSSRTTTAQSRVLTVQPTKQVPRSRSSMNGPIHKQTKQLASNEKQTLVRAKHGVRPDISTTNITRMNKCLRPDHITTSTKTTKGVASCELVITEQHHQRLPCVIYVNEADDNMASFAATLAQVASKLCDWRFTTFYQGFCFPSSNDSRSLSSKPCHSLTADLSSLLRHVDWVKIETRLQLETQQRIRWLPGSTGGVKVLKAIKATSKATRIPETQLRLAIEAIAFFKRQGGINSNSSSRTLQARDLARDGEWERLARIILDDETDLKLSAHTNGFILGQKTARDFRTAVRRCQAKYFTSLHRSHFSNKVSWRLTELATRCRPVYHSYVAPASSSITPAAAAAKKKAATRPVVSCAITVCPSSAAPAPSRLPQSPGKKTTRPAPPAPPPPPPPPPPPAAVPATPPPPYQSRHQHPAPTAPAPTFPPLPYYHHHQCGRESNFTDLNLPIGMDPNLQGLVPTSTTTRTTHQLQQQQRRRNTQAATTMLYRIRPNDMVDRYLRVVAPIMDPNLYDSVVVPTSPTSNTSNTRTTRTTRTTHQLQQQQRRINAQAATTMLYRMRPNDMVGRYLRVVAAPSGY